MAGPPTVPSSTVLSSNGQSTNGNGAGGANGVRHASGETNGSGNGHGSSNGNGSESAWLRDTLDAAASGEIWARESLSSHCLPQLTAFAAGRGANDPEGIAGTVMVEFLARLDRLSFDTPGQMWAYLYRIARSRVIDERRSLKPVEYREQDSMEALLPPTSGVEDAVTERHYVDDLLASLTSDQREVLQMRFLDDLSIEETANRTGRTLTAVKGLQRRAIRALTAAALLSVLVIGGLVLALTDIGRDDGIPTVSEGPSPSAGYSSDRAETSDQTDGFDAGGVVEPGDGVAPDTSIAIHPGADGDGADEGAAADPFAATFHFEGIDATSGIERFECSLDGAPFEPCSSPFTATGLAEGGHLFEVRAVDRIGNVDASPARHYWVVERPVGVPPGVDIAAMMASNEVLNCGSKGTWAELVDQGFDVMVGTEGDDVIDVSGGDRPDLVIGLGGNDTIITGPGDDRVCGGAGNDTITTGDGDDRVWSGGGNDTVDTNSGDDRVWASSGTDTVDGGSGDDQLMGGSGTDYLDGDKGDDRLDGESEPDVLIGGPGDDVCRVPQPEPVASSERVGDEPASDETAEEKVDGAEEPQVTTTTAPQPVAPTDAVHPTCESTTGTP